jgi:hypothetical protein
MIPKLPEPDGWFFTEEGRLVETDQYENKTVRAIQEEAYKAGMAAERERCAIFASDWLTSGRSPHGKRLAEAMMEDFKKSQEVK